MSEESAKAVVYRLLQIQLAAQISLAFQHGNMAEEKLNLFQFSAIDMPEFCEGSPKIMWREMVQLNPLNARAAGNLASKVRRRFIIRPE